MAYGFNDDKSKAQVLTAGNLKRKTLNLSYNSSTRVEAGEIVEFAINVSNEIDLDKVIGVVGVKHSATNRNMILVGLTMSPELSIFYIDLMNMFTSATSNILGNILVTVIYIDQ